VGDSIPNNSPKDCPGCTGFVTRYARKVAADTGRKVTVKNLSEHTGLQTDDLLREIRHDATRRAALKASDIVIVSIGFNDGPWRRTDDPCDGPVTYNDPSDVVSAAIAGYDEACAKQNAENFRARWNEILSTIRKLRQGRPGVLFALNRYDDWIDFRPAGFPAAADIEKVSPMVIEAWNKVLCEVAAGQGFHCDDLHTRFNGKDHRQPSGNLVVDDFTHPSQAGNDAIYRLLVGFGYEPLWP
jgi:lysophospholipase L1-like esterase